MKLSIAAVSSFVAATLAASLPEAFTLVAEGGKTALTDGSHVLIGADANENAILVLKSGNGGQVTYTREGSPPTGWQNLYVIEDAIKPVSLTVPHSGATPDKANLTGFGQSEDGYFTFGGKQLFGVSPQNPEQVSYIGLGHSNYEVTPLWVKECKGC
ncbi:hypothetical protein P170DRAFT_514621 [Aspergillus steynii IBT 23096]|uniref:Uncharacterized protein n=1 Tax=Aspergillus steynii IBT 23096 TaxID=1392250 RepID=A0A2I2FRZ5_9EURO|nr:uncharacterized protein P170DRAFT_514621 [Aspergillus steynii IBT 23096]PLB43393.1 hypothetical protein P170DRAFT_514621 [Aspergillus steynii IBT 23096]